MKSSNRWVLVFVSELVSTFLSDLSISKKARWKYLSISKQASLWYHCPDEHNLKLFGRKATNDMTEGMSVRTSQESHSHYCIHIKGTVAISVMRDSCYLNCKTTGNMNDLKKGKKIWIFHAFSHIARRNCTDNCQICTSCTIDNREHREHQHQAVLWHSEETEVETHVLIFLQQL